MINKKGQVGEAAIGLIMLATLLAVIGPIGTVITDTVTGSTLDTVAVTNETNTLLNHSATLWTNNFTHCYKQGWVVNSVIVRNTTQTVSPTWYNVSYTDCAVTLNQSASGDNAANGSNYLVSYVYYPAEYQNNTGYRSVAAQFPVFLALLALIAIIVVAMSILGR